MRAQEAASTPRQSGASLVEVVVAMVVLAVVAISTAACLSQHRAWLMLNRDRGAAREMANSRRGELRAIPYQTLAQWLPVTNCSVRYLYKTRSAWTNTASLYLEGTKMNGAAATLQTAIQFAELSNNAFNHVTITTQIGYNRRAGTPIKLLTNYVT